MEHFRESVRQLLVEASTSLPSDVRRALQRAGERESPGTLSALALRAIALNVDAASERCGPICQETGLPSFHVKVPVGSDELSLSDGIGEAVAEATRQGQLRASSVDPLTRHNSGDNRGPGMPRVRFEQWLSSEIEVRLILRGGAAENASAQYSLPCDLSPGGRAERDLDGVRKCVLHAIHTAQGRGCSAGALGVTIGGDRAAGYHHAELQLLRPLDDVNPEPALARLEGEILEGADALGIGTMGLGGAVSLLGCKVGALNRLPSSFFVTVAYNCWALRRVGAVLDSTTGAIRRWLYRDEAPHLRLAEEARLLLTGREIPLTTPLSEHEVRKLRVGDVVLLNGVIHTGRDLAHHYLAHHDTPLNLRGGALYHCSPTVVRRNEEWVVTAAGPATSLAAEPYEADLIRALGLRAVIGKGGMGRGTLEALRECGAVYLSAIGGTAQLYAECVVKAESRDFPAFGSQEAMWRLRVENFPVIVTMDAHGGSLHAEVEAASGEQLVRLVAS
jgi:fumarate hydratase class I